MKFPGRNLIPKFGEHATAWLAILALLGGLLTFIGWDFPPWSSMTRAQSVSKELEALKVETVKDRDEIKTDQRVMTRALLRLDRQYWEKQLADAEADLKANPESVSAKKAKREAADQITYIDEQLKPGTHP